MYRFFIERPVLSAVIALLILMAGVVAGLQLPIAQYPRIIPPAVQVQTLYPGASADVVAQSVAAPLEQQINGANGMIYMDSISANSGAYTLTVSFDVGTNQDLAAVDVQNRIAVAQGTLPPEVLRQGITLRKASSGFLEVLALTSPDGSFDPLFLGNYALLHVQDPLTRIPGVGQVTLLGSLTNSMRIWLDPQKMAGLGVTARDVFAVVTEQNAIAPAGRIGLPPAPEGQEMQYTALLQGRLGEPAEYEAIVLRTAPNGKVVRLGDVARVEIAPLDSSVSARENGKPAAFVGIALQATANALDVDKQVHSTMTRLAKDFPPGLKWSVPYTTIPFVTSSLRELVLTLLEAFGLVALVVFLFLQSWRATLIPILVVPISLVGTLAALLALGFQLQVFTLFGLVLAIGIVVDDAIVVVEAVQQRLDAGAPSAKEAAISAMADVGGPVVAIALVLAAVFVPVAFIGGLTGQLYRQFALTLAVSVMLSAICALTFTPAMCALLLRPVDRSQAPRGPVQRTFALFNRVFDGLRKGYLDASGRMIRHMGLVAVTFAAMVAALWLVASTRPSELIPDEDQGVLLALTNLPPGASLERTIEASRQLEGIVSKLPEVSGVASVAGLNFLSGVPASYTATHFIRLKPWGERKRTAKQILGGLMGQLNGGIRDAQVIVLNPPPIPGLSSTGGFTFVLEDRSSGDDPARLGQVLQEFLGKAHQRKELGQVFASYDPRIPQIRYEVDRDHVKTLGVPLDDVFFTLQTFFGGTYINDFNQYGRPFRVMAQAEGRDRSQPEDVRAFEVRSASGDMVPLRSVVSFKTVNAPDYQERYNLFPAVTINGSPAPGVSSGAAIKAMEELAAGLPAGFSFEWSQATYQEKKAGGASAIVLLSLAFVFLVLAALYESWSLPISILLVIPFAMLGAYLGLLLRGMEQNVYTQIALIMLVGLSAKNAILIVEFAVLARKRGASIVDAALQSGHLRLRPILMTSFAFILGTLPLAIATGAGAAARRSLGTAVVFGMLGATLVGTLFIPVFYVAMRRLSERRRRSPMTKPAPA